MLRMRGSNAQNAEIAKDVENAQMLQKLRILRMPRKLRRAGTPQAGILSKEPTPRPPCKLPG